jgi:hypothetical protein
MWPTNPSRKRYTIIHKVAVGGVLRVIVTAHSSRRHLHEPLGEGTGGLNAIKHELEKDGNEHGT